MVYISKKSTMHLRFLVLLLLPVFAFGQLEADPNWYAELSPDSFFNTAAAQQTIDLEKPDLALLEMAIFFATNEQRMKRKGDPFLPHQQLNAAARFHSEEMRDKRFFSHQNKSDKDNRHPEDRIRNQGETSFVATGENILEMTAYKLRPNEEYTTDKQADGSFSYQNMRGKPLPILSYGDFARAALKVWMRSEGHKANILDKNFTHLGCGVAFDPEPFKFKSLPQVLVTQNFGRPQE
jgi:uncharacterized protein YkwD